jgi:glycosyltransferase involved in cell wall biosynthesis
MGGDDGPPVALTVILPVYNGAASVADQLDALVTQEWSEPWEVLVVDNASTDDTPAIVERYVKSHPDRIRVVPAPDDHNLAYVRNVGVRHARGAAVAFCDDDDLIGERWVPAMGEALRDHPLVGSHMDYARLSTEAARTNRADFQSAGIELLFGIPVVNGVSGVQRSLWDELGGNDETLDATGEDLDFAIRAHLHQGVDPFFADDAVYHVRRRDRSATTFRQARRYGRAMALLYARYGRRRGAGRSTAKEVVWAWTWLALHVGDLRSAPRAVGWAWRAGMRLGRLEGSLRHRVVYL